MGGIQYHQSQMNADIISNCNAITSLPHSGNTLSSSSSSSSSLATTVANCSTQGSGLSVTPLLPSTPAANASILSNLDDSSDGTSCDASSAIVSSSRNTTIDSNVLNDIGNMLANLTDELDAMLEEEKRAGLNDSE